MCHDRRSSLSSVSLKTASTDLRVGILLDSPGPRAWQAHVIDHLREVDGVRLCVMGLAGPVAGDTNTTGAGWARFVQFATRRSRAMTHTDLRYLPDDVPVISQVTPSLLTPSIEGAAKSWEDRSTLDSHGPDVIINLSETPVGDELLRRPRFGVWTYRHGGHPRGEPACLREVVKGHSVTTVAIERAAADSLGRSIMAEAVFQTVPHSYRQNLDQAMLGAAELAARACRQVLVADIREPDLSAPTEAIAGVDETGLGSLPAFLAKTAWRWVRRQFVGLTAADRWHVGMVNRPIDTLLDSPELTDVQWFDRPSGTDRYVADPFGVSVDGGVAVLVEDYDHRGRHGRIAGYRIPDVQDVGGPIRSGQPLEVASFTTHASYPYLLEVDGEWWCVPETLAAADVTAFRFDPDQMHLEELGVLLEDMALADPTVFSWNGYWWLFATDANRGANTHLRAWFADHPLGPWTQHAIDPLRIDVRYARGAGTPFVHNGKLYRPAQDCSRSYGGSISIMHVETLDPVAFTEDVAAEVHADPQGDFPDGTHTVSRLDGRFLVDGTRRQFSTSAFTHEFGARWRRLAGRL